MSSGGVGTGPARGGEPGLLESWKEIATYLKRDVRTVQRWEKREGLPVHRHLHEKAGSVYAYGHEIDEWWRSRRVRLEAERAEPEIDPVAGPSTDLGRVRRIWIPTLALMVVLLAIAAVVKLWPSLPVRPASAIRMLVLPFANLSGDPEQEYLSDGITDEIILQLTRMDPEQLRVISRSTAMFYKGSRKRPDEVGKELGVDYVLEGTVRRSGPRVRVTVQLNRVVDRLNLWSESYEQDLGDALAMQQGVARELARRLRLNLAGSTVVGSTDTVQPEAYRQYLLGRYFWNRRGPNAVEQAMQHFETATRLDPQYARAYAGLADCHALLGSTAASGTLSPLEAMPKAKSAVLRALELDPNLAEAHATLGYIHLIYDWDLRAAEQRFKRAAQLDARYPNLHQWYALYFIANGDSSSAINELKTALELDPLSLSVNTALAEAYYYARDYDAAIQQARRALELNPNFVLAQFNLGRAESQKGNHGEAIAALEKARMMSRGTPGQVMALGYAAARAGDHQRARQMLAVLEDSGRKRHVPEIYLAAIHTGLGDLDRAFYWLEKAYARRAESLIYLKMEPMADPLRSDPRFADLMGRVTSARGR